LQNPVHKGVILRRTKVCSPNISQILQNVTYYFFAATAAMGWAAFCAARRQRPTGPTAAVRSSRREDLVKCGERDRQHKTDNDHPE
jgi:hypothetical protein